MAVTRSREEPAAAFERVRRLSLGWRAVLFVFTCIVVLLAVNQAFNLNFLIGLVLLDNHYLYALLGLMLSLVFVIFPVSKGQRRDRVPWYDVAMFLATLGVVGFYVINSNRILDLGWEFGAPDYAVYVSYVMWLLVLEGARRAGGLTVFAIVVAVSLYPVIADQVPGPISGLPSPLPDTAAYHAMSNESLLGIPMRAVGNLVIGFLIFGVALQHTGGGKFFINLAFALLGHVRGGPAKVAIFASGLMGSVSGSVITNVLTTGVMTIPAMRRTGFAPAYAGGVEACASTGGVLMPPIMGSTAFVMATFLEVSYAEVAIAAVLPSALYFFGLFMQIDSHAARHDMPGLPRNELPKIIETFKQGWHFLFVFGVLIFMLLYLKREVLAPYYATPLLILLNQFNAEDRWSWADVRAFVLSLGQLLAELIAVLAAVGLVIGALSLTGMAGTLVNDLVYLAGGSTIVLLLMGALTSFIMGIGMTVTAAYIFLAILLAPALVQGGLDRMAVHMFILYWGMLSFITPPVALGAFAAATVAGANFMRTGLEAMRLGSIIYFIPFFFVLDPAFILKGDWDHVLLTFGNAVIGVVLISGGLQGHLVGIGKLGSGSFLEWPIRALVIAGGLVLALPGGGLIPWSNGILAVTAAAALVPAFALSLWIRRTQPA